MWIELLRLTFCSSCPLIQADPVFCLKERPCQRCVKRSIGHLCHDEPRESTRGHKAEKENGNGHHEVLLKQEVLQPNILAPSLDQQQNEQPFMHDAAGQIPSSAAMQRNLTTQPPRPTPSAAQIGGYGGNNQQCECCILVKKAFGLSDLEESHGLRRLEHGQPESIQ